MAITRSDLLKELQPGLEALFGIEYDKYKDDPRMPIFAEKPSYEIEVNFDE